MGRALSDGGIAQWVEQSRWWDSSVGRALSDGGIAQWVEHYQMVGQVSGRIQFIYLL